MSAWSSAIFYSCLPQGAVSFLHYASVCECSRAILSNFQSVSWQVPRALGLLVRPWWLCCEVFDSHDSNCDVNFELQAQHGAMWATLVFLISFCFLVFQHQVPTGDRPHPCGVSCWWRLPLHLLIQHFSDWCCGVGDCPCPARNRLLATSAYGMWFP